MIATWHIGAHVVPTTLHIAGDGTLTKVTLMRWGSPNGPPPGEHLFAALLSEPIAFDGITIPTRWEAGWFYGTPAWKNGRFFEAKITDARFTGPCRARSEGSGTGASLRCSARRCTGS